jgi:hypothetical protein
MYLVGCFTFTLIKEKKNRAGKTKKVALYTNCLNLQQTADLLSVSV